MVGRASHRRATTCIFSKCKEMLANNKREKEKEERAKTMFDGTAINMSTEGHQHRGALLGSRKHLEDYVEEKVEDWISQIVRLAEFTQSHPQASYVAYTFGLRHRWTYFLRTLPNIEDLLKPLERAISDVLIPSNAQITQINGSQMHRT